MLSVVARSSVRTCGFYAQCCRCSVGRCYLFVLSLLQYAGVSLPNDNAIVALLRAINISPRCGRSMFACHREGAPLSPRSSHVSFTVAALPVPFSRPIAASRCYPRALMSASLALSPPRCCHVPLLPSVAGWSHVSCACWRPLQVPTLEKQKSLGENNPLMKWYRQNQKDLEAKEKEEQRQKSELQKAAQAWLEKFYQVRLQRAKGSPSAFALAQPWLEVRTEFPCDLPDELPCGPIQQERY